MKTAQEQKEAQARYNKKHREKKANRAKVDKKKKALYAKRQYAKKKARLAREKANGTPQPGSQLKPAPTGPQVLEVILRSEHDRILNETRAEFDALESRNAKLEARIEKMKKFFDNV